MVFVEKINAVEFSVSGMHCKSCLMLVKINLKELEGVKDVSGSWEKGSVQVAFDEGKASIKEIMKKIEQEGYKVVEYGRK